MKRLLTGLAVLAASAVHAQTYDIDLTMVLDPNPEGHGLGTYTFQGEISPTANVANSFGNSPFTVYEGSNPLTGGTLVALDGYSSIQAAGAYAEDLTYTAVNGVITSAYTSISGGQFAMECGMADYNNGAPCSGTVIDPPATLAKAPEFGVGATFAAVTLLCGGILVIKARS
jgi:hypothetical protein